MDYIWHQIRRFWQHRKQPRLVFELDQATRLALQRRAEVEQRPNGELAAELLSDALARLEADGENWGRWQSLTARQQQVAALACLGLTNRQIAARLVISPETVKTHMRNVLYKFELRSKAELQRALANWDFSGWKEIRG